MWSRIISWILAAIASLMNGFGMYTQEYKPYIAAGEYTIQEEAVDYTQLRSWYISSYGGAGSCKVERKPGNASKGNVNGFVWLVDGGDHNPDAKLEFESGTVLLAPSKGKITTSPNSSGNKITVVCDANDWTAYRLEIIDPEKWFCCVDEEPSASGHYIHSNADHKIDLKQGDIICVAGPQTTLKMYRGNSAGVLKECESVRDFLMYTASEGGNSDVNMSEGGNLRPSGDGNTNPGSNMIVPGVPDADVFSQQGNWYQGDGGRWWYGTDQTDWENHPYAHNQYVYYNGDWYYLDENGYMVTGHHTDGHYYLDRALDTHPEGAMAIRTIIPITTGDWDGNAFTYVNDDGLVDFESGTDAVNVGSTTYVKSGDCYVKVSGAQE